MMRKHKILVVDDEANTRTTLQAALGSLGYELLMAASGDEALGKLSDPRIGLMLLDLRMPGVSGLDVLRQVESERPDIRVVIVTAHGTVDSAVESMKRGAVTVLQKPFSLAEIRALVRAEMEPSEREGKRKSDYESHVDAARAKIREDMLDAAVAHLREAERIDPTRPEAFNLLGVVHELRHDRVEARRQYSVALQLRPSYRAARENLENVNRPPAKHHAPTLGEESDGEV
jgi:DNA-binding NtrC family response regulator